MMASIRGLARNLVLLVACIIGMPSWSQLVITDRVQTINSNCTNYAYDPAAKKLTLSPDGCMSCAAGGADPVFSIRTVPAGPIAQPLVASSTVQQIEVYVDADKDIPCGKQYSLTFYLCTAAQGCDPTSGVYSFFKLSGLGGSGFTAADRITTTGTTGIAFNFRPALDTSPSNARSMRIGRFDIPNTPLFGGTKSVMMSLSGAAASTAVTTLAITGGSQVAGVDYDINGAVIPSPSGPVGANMLVCAYPTLPQPGGGSGPCGAYEIPVGNCTTGMTGANAITKAWLYVLEDYTGGSGGARVGKPIMFPLQRNHAMVFRFKTGADGTFPEFNASPFYRGFQYAFEEAGGDAGPAAVRFVTLSETRCDFDYTKTDADNAATPQNLNGCYQTVDVPIRSGTTLGRIYKPGTEPSTTGVPGPYPYCTMKPNTTYYMNIRFENAKTTATRGAISCTYANCGQLITIN